MNSDWFWGIAAGVAIMLFVSRRIRQANRATPPLVDQEAPIRVDNLYITETEPRCEETHLFDWDMSGRR
jgi:hypothetical protein